jgi:hypothetical protein
MLTVAGQSGNVQQMNARMWAMIATHHLGDLLIAQWHAGACIQLGTPSNQAARLTTIFDPVVPTLVESSRNLWMMGDTRGCLDRTWRAIELARENRHPDSRSFALLFSRLDASVPRGLRDVLPIDRGSHRFQLRAWPCSDNGGVELRFTVTRPPLANEGDGCVSESIARRHRRATPPYPRRSRPCLERLSFSTRRSKRLKPLLDGTPNEVRPRRPRSPMRSTAR